MAELYREITKLLPRYCLHWSRQRKNLSNRLFWNHRRSHGKNWSWKKWTIESKSLGYKPSGRRSWVNFDFSRETYWMSFWKKFSNHSRIGEMCLRHGILTLKRGVRQVHRLEEIKNLKRKIYNKQVRFYSRMFSYIVLVADIWLFTLLSWSIHPLDCNDYELLAGLASLQLPNCLWLW